MLDTEIAVAAVKKMRQLAGAEIPAVMRTVFSISRVARVWPFEKKSDRKR